MEIIVTTGTGEGPSPLAAFDAALFDAGIANYNLVYLSSIIPPRSIVRFDKYIASPNEYGHRLYVVMSYFQTQISGEVACAGLGWVQDEYDDGRGIFVEINGIGREDVENKIHITLKPMIDRRKIRYNVIMSKISEITCQERPVCALVAAIYRSYGWEE